MSSPNDDIIDEATLKLSGLIGVFDLIVDNLTGDRNSERSTMLNFAYFISRELQELLKTISGVDYRE